MKKNVLSLITMLFVLNCAYAQQNTHLVASKETIYGISKQYNIPIEKLYEWNPGLKENGLKEGQILKLAPSANVAVDSTSKVNSINQIKVEAGETVYSLAVNYKTTVSKIFELNPEVEKNGLKEGQLLILPSNSIVEKNRLYTKEVKEISNPLPISTKSDLLNNKNVQTIIVQPKETLYNISKSYNVTIEQLIQWNPQLESSGLQTGMELIVAKPSVKKYDLIPEQSAEFHKVPVKAEGNPKVYDFSKAKSHRNLSILLPFNIEQFNFNQPISIRQRLNKDVFLNMTLDFYSGALLAIEEAKDKNLPLTVSILDSKEANRSMDVQKLLREIDIQKTDVVIGPFYQKNVDAVSKALEGTEVLVVSPLSVEKGQPYANQLHAMPNTEDLSSAMLDYILKQNQNVVAVCKDNQRLSFFENQHFSAVSASGLKSTTIQEKLSKTQKNYVILDSNNLQTAIDLVQMLNKLQKEYDIQLVVLDKTDFLDSTELDIKQLANLHLMYPSITLDADNHSSTEFTKWYTEVYGYKPNRFAIRGYDLTKDVIERMFLSDDRAANIFDQQTQRVANKFAYVVENGGVYNKAVYILYYDKDLTIKEAK